MLSSHFMFGRGRNALTSGSPSRSRKLAHILLGAHDHVDIKQLEKGIIVGEGIEASGNFLKALAEELSQEIEKRSSDSKGEDSTLSELKKNLEKLNKTIEKFEKAAKGNADAHKNLASICRFLQKFRNILDSHEFTAATDVAKAATKIGVTLGVHGLSGVATMGISIGVSVGMVLALIIADKGLDYYRKTVEEDTIKILDAFDSEIKQLNMEAIQALEVKAKMTSYPGKVQMLAYLKSVSSYFKESLSIEMGQKDHKFAASTGQRSIREYHLLLSNASSLLQQVQSGTKDELSSRLKEIEYDLKSATASLKKTMGNLGKLKMVDLGLRKPGVAPEKSTPLKKAIQTTENYLLLLKNQVKILEQEYSIVDTLLTQKFGVDFPAIEMSQRIRKEEKQNQRKNYRPTLPPITTVMTNSMDRPFSPLSPMSPTSPEVLGVMDSAHPPSKKWGMVKSIQVKLGKGELENRQNKTNHFIEDFNLVISRFDEQLNILNQRFTGKFSFHELRSSEVDLEINYKKLVSLLEKIDERHSKYEKAQHAFNKSGSKEEMHAYKELANKYEELREQVGFAKKLRAQMSLYDHTNSKTVQKSVATQSVSRYDPRLMGNRKPPEIRLRKFYQRLIGQ